MMSTSIVLKQNRCIKKVYNPLVEPVLTAGWGCNPLYSCVLARVYSAIPNKLCRVVLAPPITIPSPLGVGCVVTHRKSLENGYKTQHAQLEVVGCVVTHRKYKEGRYKKC